MINSRNLIYTNILDLTEQFDGVIVDGCLIAASCDNSAAFDDSHYLLCLGNNYLHNVLTPVK